MVKVEEATSIIIVFVYFYSYLSLYSCICMSDAPEHCYGGPCTHTGLSKNVAYVWYNFHCNIMVRLCLGECVEQVGYGWSNIQSGGTQLF